MDEETGVIEMPKVLNIPGAFNIRDLGGLTGRDNQTIEYHQLIRGGFLSEIENEGLEQLQDYGVATVIDLRSPNEVAKFPDRLSADFDYFQIPIFEDDATDSTLSIDEINKLYANDDQYGYERMLKSYRKMVIEPHAINAFGNFFRRLIVASQKGGILFHCSAGKDRTGVTGYLLLAILGVDASSNFDNYLASNAASRERIAWRISEAKKAHLGACFVRSIHDLVVVKRDYLEQATSLINYEFGGIDEFVRSEIGLSDEETDALRTLFLSKK